MSLTSRQLDRLLPFLKKKSARQRIILYLFADGYSVPQLVAMKLPEFEEIIFPDDFFIYRDEFLVNKKNDNFFIYPLYRKLTNLPHQNVIQSLLDNGHTIDELKKTPMINISDYDVAELVKNDREILAYQAKENYAFTFPSGTNLIHTDFYRLLRSTTVKVLNKKLTQDEFHRYITNNDLS